LRRVETGAVSKRAFITTGAARQDASDSIKNQDFITGLADSMFNEKGNCYKLMSDTIECWQSSGVLLTKVAGPL